jgi:hypothetical protein
LDASGSQPKWLSMIVVSIQLFGEHIARRGPIAAAKSAKHRSVVPRRMYRM